MHVIWKTKMSLRSYPFTWTENDKDDQEKRAQLWRGPKSMAISIKQMISDPIDLNMPKYFTENNMHTQIWNLKPRKDDLWIVTYPKSGTTMASEMLWQMSTGCNVKSKESRRKLILRVPFLEYSCLSHGMKMDNPTFENDEKRQDHKAYLDFMKDTIKYVEETKSPRIIKTHLPLSMLPPNLLDVSKVVFVARNVKDVCVSFFHMEQMNGGGLPKDTSFDDYVKFFMSGRPGVYGNYWNHLKDGLKNKGNPNMKLVWYEDLNNTFEDQVTDLADFLGYEMTDDKMEVLKEHMKIDNFRKNDAVNGRPPPGAVPDEVRKNWNFIRKGKVGGWKDYFNKEETLNKFDEWVEENNMDVDGNPIKGLRFE